MAFSASQNTPGSRRLSAWAYPIEHQLPESIAKVGTPSEQEIFRQACELDRYETNRIWWIRGVMLFAIALLHLGTLRSDHDWGGDFAQYLSQAACLATGSFEKFTEQTAFRYEHSTDLRIGPKYYPWGYPAILAPIYAWRGLDFVPLKFVTTLFLLFSLLVIDLLLRAQLTASRRLLLVGLIGFNPALVAAKDHLLSDVPFLFFALATLWFFNVTFPSWKREGHPAVHAHLEAIGQETFRLGGEARDAVAVDVQAPPERPRSSSRIASPDTTSRTASYFTNNGWLAELARASLLGILLFAACSIRATGMVLVATTVLVPLYRHFMGARKAFTNSVAGARIVSRSNLRNQTGAGERRVGIKLLVALTVFGLLTLIGQTFLPHDSSYATQFKLLTMGHLAHNMVYYSLLPALFFSPLSDLVGGVVYIATVPLFLKGLWRKSPGDDVYIIFSSLLLALLVAWPSTRQGLRFIYPILPLYLYFVLRESQFRAVGRFGSRPLQFGWVWAAISLAAALAQIGWQATIPRVDGPYQKDVVDLFALVRQQVGAADRVSFFKPRVLTLYTGRFAADVSDPGDPRAEPIHWFIYRRSHPETIARAQRYDLEEVFRNATFVVLKRRSARESLCPLLPVDGGGS